MDCPYCGFSAPRMSLHSHLVEEHADAAERADETTYRLRNPEGNGIEVGMEAGADEDAAERFSNEVLMLAFDRLLNRLEEKEG